MKKAEKQQLIARQECKDTLTADQWLAAQGIDNIAFAQTPALLLLAQRQANQLLIQHGNLLTTSQQGTLEKFQQLMANKATRTKLKPQAAYPILNISSKIYRQLFRQHRQLSRAQS